jgi:glycerol dehydrogenase
VRLPDLSGGGKTIDTGKAAAQEAGVPLVVAPTIASNDAPCSRVAIIYSESGVLEKALILKRNPELVLVDTQIIAGAPVRFLVAGMGDALATKFEADQCMASNSLNIHRGLQTQASIGLSDLCYRLIRENGLKAKQSAECKVVSEALERVIEANILLSGIGFESGGLAIAHALTRGFSMIPETHGSLHGEEVAFGVLVQMVVENRSDEFMADLMGFYRQIGLPAPWANWA